MNFILKTVRRVTDAPYRSARVDALASRLDHRVCALQSRRAHAGHARHPHRTLCACVHTEG